MLSVVNTKLGESYGVPRVWLEGRKLQSFVPGQRLSVVFDKDNKVAQLKPANDDLNESKVSVSQRSRNGRIDPLIEIRSEELRNVFGDVGVLLRVVIKGDALTIEAHGLDKKTAERVARLENKLQSGEPLAIGSLFSGGGVMDSAIHEGLSKAGIPSFSKFVVEREFSYIDAMMRNSPDLFTKESIAIESDIEKVEFRNASQAQVDILVAGIPCTGASKAGRTKNKLANAEEHSEAGACFFYFLNFVALTNPAVVVVENVDSYKSTASYTVIKSVLTNFGYELTDSVLNGVEFGGLENRDRLCLVAVSKGLKSFDFANVRPLVEKKTQLIEVLEDIPDDDPRWKSYSYLADKEVRDKADGKGFKRTLVDGSEECVPTLRRLYHKGGSCDTFVSHPDGVRSRLFTASEHARIKGVPQRLIAGLSETTAHEVLGQSVVYPVFLSVGFAIGEAISKRHSNNFASSVAA